MVQVPECPLIEVSGSPRERGRQYGEQAANRIKRGVEHYSAQLETNRLKKSDLDVIIELFTGSIRDFGAHYLEEMEGIAEGAGIDLTSVVLLNARTEVLKMSRRRQKGEPDFVDPDGCTGLVVLPRAAANGQLIHAQNWDWKAECVETAVVLKIRRDDGPDIITFTEAGGLARTGFNAAGVAISGNYLESDRDYRELGVPLALVRRQVLEQSQYALSAKAVYGTRKSASNNMIVSQANGIAIDFECAPDETFPVLPVNDLIVHANHFQSPVALSKLIDCGIPNMPDSLYRDQRVRSLLEPHHGSLTVDHVKGALFDDFETPWSVCRPPRSTFTNNQSATVAMIVMQPAIGKIEVALLPALNRNFVTYGIDVDIHKPTAATDYIKAIPNQTAA